jgi:hypothetical protein
MNRYLTRPATPAAIHLVSGRYCYLNNNREENLPIKRFVPETASTTKETKREIAAIKDRHEVP